ncbi:transporter substrate-binding domain-containing protein [Bosea thiooxidans]
MFSKLVAFGLAAAAFSVFAAPASAQATLEGVRKRGKVLCGVSPTAPGFSYADDKGVRQGFDADVCRAVSAAVFGTPDKVDFVPLNTNVRFQGLQSGEVDLLSRQTTATFSRDASLGLDFAPVVFYDGQGLMVSTKLGVKSAAELSQSAVCILPGTTTLQNLELLKPYIGTPFNADHDLRLPLADLSHGRRRLELARHAVPSSKVDRRPARRQPAPAPAGRSWRRNCASWSSASTLTTSTGGPLWRCCSSSAR